MVSHPDGFLLASEGEKEGLKFRDGVRMELGPDEKARPSAERSKILGSRRQPFVQREVDAVSSPRMRVSQE